MYEENANDKYLLLKALKYDCTSAEYTGGGIPGNLVPISF